MRPIPDRISYRRQLHRLDAIAQYTTEVATNGHSGFTIEKERLAGWTIPTIHDVEHYRFQCVVGPSDAWRWEQWDQVPQKVTYLHVAVVVADDGCGYVGTALPSFYDSYNRKVGFAIAMGRALNECLEGAPAFMVDTTHIGIALRDECRRLVVPWLRDHDFPVVESPNQNQNQYRDQERDQDHDQNQNLSS